MLAGRGDCALAGALPDGRATCVTMRDYGEWRGEVGAGGGGAAFGRA